MSTLTSIFYYTFVSQHHQSLFLCETTQCFGDNQDLVKLQIVSGISSAFPNSTSRWRASSSRLSMPFHTIEAVFDIAE